jgi:hypothetical protein
MQLLGSLVAGFLVSLVTTPAGVSGAVLLLPIQVSVLGVPSPAVTPTNLIFNLFATPSGILRYRRLRPDALRSPLATRLVSGTVPGVVLGAIVRVEWLSGEEALYTVAAVVLGSLGVLLVTRIPTSTTRGLPIGLVPAIAFLVGVVGGVYGIGGGSFLAPILLVGGYSIYEVAPAALLSTMAASVVGVVAFVILSAVSASPAHIVPDWTVGIAAGVGGVFGAYCGASLQSRIPEGALRRLLGVVALVIALRYTYLALGV